MVIKEEGEATFPVAHVVLNETEDLAVILGRINSLCADRLDADIIPRAYKVRKTFDLNPTSGKIDIAALKAENEGFVDCYNHSVSL